MSHMQVFDWHKWFSTGCDNVGDDPKSGRPLKSRNEANIEKVKRLIRCDRKLTIRMMTEQLGFALESTTVSQHFYKEVLRRISSRVRRIRWNFWEVKNWVVHHDNAPSHSAISVKQFLTEKQVAVLDHPPYSLNLALCDF